ncbi:MAG: class I SAM-dependent methyltransferase [Endomicrobiales bacterium]
MHCLMCGSPCNGHPIFSVTDRLDMARGRYDVLRCPSCGSVRVSPMPSDDELAGMYPTGYNFKIEPSDHGFSRALKTVEWHAFYRPILKRNYRLISRIVGRAAFSVLDIGCGSGLRLEIFKEAGCDVEGNETSAACVSYIRDRCAIPIHEGRIETLDIKRQYDVVTLFALLEHLADPVPVIRAVHKLLKPGGKVIIQVPVVDSIQFKMLGKRAAMVNDMPRHVFIPSLAGLIGFMRKQGFKLHTRYPVSVFERATLCALGLMPSSATPVAYRESLMGKMVVRIAGWALTVFPGLAVAALESFTGVGAEIISVFEKCENDDETITPGK